MENKESNKIELEKENFKVDSSDWELVTDKRGTTFLKNPNNDIWELFGGIIPNELVGQQLFSYQAAMRESEKAGKRMPTSLEVEMLEEEDFGKIVYAGFREWFATGVFYNRGLHNAISGNYGLLSQCVFFWSSSISTSYAWKRGKYSKRVIKNHTQQHSGHSVRCVKD